MTHLTSIGRDEAADLDIAAKTNIPNDGFANGVSGVSNDRLFRHPPPHIIDWNPISSRSHVVLRAMSIGNVATGNASRAAHAFEPSANVVRDIFKLSVIDCESRSGEEGQRHQQNKLRGLPHRHPSAYSHANEARIMIWPQVSKCMMAVACKINFFVHPFAVSLHRNKIRMSALRPRARSIRVYL